MSEQKPRILVVGDALYSVTGLAYVAGYMTKLFLESELFSDVGYFTLTSDFVNIPKEKFKAIDEPEKYYENLRLFNTYYENLLESFDKAIEQFRPHIIFSVSDPWMTEPIAHSKYRPSYCWIAYTTVEVPEYSNKIYNPSVVFKNQNYKNILENLVLADSVISVTKQGIEALKNITHSTIKLDNLYEENIYNGIEIEKRNTEQYQKSQLFAGMCKDNDFIFMVLGANTERKKLDQSILAFSKFLKKVNNPKKYKLYIYTNSFSSLGGTDLVQVAMNENVLPYLLGNKATTVVPKHEIYKYYNVCDCILNFSGGEGFGYSIAEGMLHEKPIIYLDYGGPSEYAYHGGLPVKVGNYVYAMRWGIQWGLPNLDSASDQMVKIAKDENVRKNLGKTGYEWAKNNLDWEVLKYKLYNAIFSVYDNLDNKVLLGKEIKRIV